MQPSEIEFYSEKRRIYTAHYKANSDKYIIIVPPLFEEMPRTRKTFVNLARDISAKGINVVRFDYYGTGLSYGRFNEFSISGAAQDLQDAVDYCKQCGCGSIQLIGLRFGGYLAIKYLNDNIAIKKAILWEPILDLKRYWDELMRIVIGSELIMYGSVRHGKDELISMLKESGEIAIDGYPVSPNMHREFMDSYIYSHEKLSGFNERVVTIYWRNKKDHENILGFGIKSHFLSADTPSWDSIRYINNRFPELFSKTISETLQYDNADVRVQK